MENLHRPEKILIFELNWLGDILFSFPLLRALRQEFPEAYISCAVVPRYADLLAYNPWISDVHVLSDENGITTLGEKLAFVGLLKKEKYDMCLFLKPSSTKTVMALLAGISERVGFSGKNAPLTREVDIPTGEVHRADQLLALAAAIGVNEADGMYEYFIDEEYEEKAGELIHKEGRGANRIVALNAGGNWGPKRWPPENFALLAKMLLARFNDIEIMIPGSPKDLEVSQYLVSESDPERCYTLAGRTGLNELAALFKRSVLVVSADSGPLHLASATGVATIGLFGPTSQKLTGPRGSGENIVIQSEVPCKIPCYVEECGMDFRCMKSITPERVFREAERVLAGS
jgi:lipopolysaccharide heptosyltransferase II